MIDIYTEHHPHQHPVIPIEHLKMVGAQYYTSLLSKLTSHINNDDVHVTNKDKVEWEKAFLDIKDLKDKVDNLEPSSSSKDDNNYATKDYVDGQLSGYATVGALNNYVSFDDLNSRNYATEAWVLKQIKDIDPHIDLDGYVTDEELAAAIVNLATKSDIMQLSNKDNLLDMRINDLQDQIDGIEKYELPVATNTVLGGFKAGYQSSGNNYAVKMDGEYAYVSIPFSTTGGDDIEVTETYNIIVTDNTLKMVPIYEGSSQMHISGYVSWKIFKQIGSSTSYVIPGSEGIASYAELLPVNERLSLTIDTNRGIYTGSTTSHTSSVDYVKIVVEINGNIVATQVIAVQVPGKDGQAVIQTIPDAMIRMRGEYGSDMEYSNGDYADENGYRWIDIVSYNGVYYRALKNGQLDPPTDANGNLNSSEWSRYSVFGDAAFNSIISKYISAQSITAEQIVILEDYDSANPIPVAGIVGKNKYTYNGVDYSIIRTTGPGDVDNPVVIFAGTTSNDLTKAPFRVYKDGSLVAKNADIQGSVTVIGEGGQSSCELAADTELGAMPHLALKDTSSGCNTFVSAQNINLSNRVNSLNITPTGIDTNGTISATNLAVNGNFLYKGAECASCWIKFQGDNGNVLMHFENGILVGFWWNEVNINDNMPTGTKYINIQGITDVRDLTKS